MVLTLYLVSVGILAFFSSAQAKPTADDNTIELHFHVGEQKLEKDTTPPSLIYNDYNSKDYKGKRGYVELGRQQFPSLVISFILRVLIKLAAPICSRLHISRLISTELMCFKYFG